MLLTLIALEGPVAEAVLVVFLDHRAAERMQRIYAHPQRVHLWYIQARIAARSRLLLHPRNYIT
jgi:hypothetical protein